MSQIQAVKVNYMCVQQQSVSKFFHAISIHWFYLMYCTSNGPIPYFKCFPVRLNKLQQATYV